MLQVALTFGDPLQIRSFKNIDESHTKVYCNLSDGVCAGAFIISPAHLSYAATDATDAAQFAKEIIGTV